MAEIIHTQKYLQVNKIIMQVVIISAGNRCNSGWLLMKHTAGHLIFTHTMCVCACACMCVGDVAKMFYLWWIWDQYYSSIQGHALWLSEHAQFYLCVSVCVHLPWLQAGGTYSKGRTETQYLQYSPKWVFIFRRQDNLLAYQTVLAILPWEHIYNGLVYIKSNPAAGLKFRALQCIWT